MSFNNINQLISITGITTKNIIPENEIRIIRGGGYTGSWYYANFKTPGQWYSDGTPIPGATNYIWIMSLQYEGKHITFRTSEIVSNTIQLYVPTMTNGLIAWFDAYSFGNDGTTNDVRIVRWNSKINPDIFLYQNDLQYRPTLTTNNITGLPTVYARRSLTASSTSYFRFNDITKLPNGSSPSHVFVATYYGKAKYHTGGTYGTNSNLGLMGWGKAGSFRDIIFKDEYNMPAIQVNNNALGLSGSAQPRLLDNNSIISSFVNGNKGEISLNGYPGGVKNMNSNTEKTNGYLFRGIQWQSRYHGSIQDILIFNRKVSDEHKQCIEGYMAHKWKMTASLAANHPYKNIPPPPPINPEPEYSIYVQEGSGTGYAGSIYSANFDEPGQWYADGVAIPGATAFTWTMTAAYEGKVIEFRSENYNSNQIQLFVPKNVPGLISWFDAYDSSTISLSGNQVTQWNSKVNNNWVSQATASARPTYSAIGRNNRPAINTDGTTDFMTFNTNKVLPTGNNPSHIFSVAFLDPSATGVDRILLSWAGTADANIRAVYRNASGNAAIYSTSTLISSSYIWYNNDLIISSLFSKDSDGTVRLEMGVNGSVPAINNSTSGILNGLENIATLFKRSETNTGYFMGSTQEILVYETDIDEYNRQKIEGYLAHKWGLTDKLPIIHPYKISPPTPEITIQPNTIGVYSGNGQAGSLLFANFSEPGQWCIDNTPIDGETSYYLEIASEYESRAITFKTETLTSNTYITFDPVFASGMVGWFDVNEFETIEMDENNVISRWNSKTSNGMYVSQDNISMRPIYELESRNTLPAIVSDGVDDFFNFNDYQLLPQGGDPSHAFVVAYHRNISDNAYTGVLIWGQRGNTNARYISAKTNNGYVFSTGFGSGSDMNSTKIWYDQDHITSTFMSSSDSQMFVDGDQSIINTNTYNTSGTTATIFKDLDNGSWKGSVQEIVIFNKRLPLNEVQKMEGYLAHKWKLVDLLPSTHPYKKYFPTITSDMYDIKSVQRISGDGGIGSTYFTRMRGGQWYFNNEPTGITGYYITITNDMIGSMLYYQNDSTMTTKIYIPGIPYDYRDTGALAAWFDASDTAYMTKNPTTNAVSNWTSKSVSVPDAIQTTAAAQPTYQPYGLDGSRPTIYADGVDDRFTIASRIATNHTTVFTVMKTLETANPGNWYNSPGFWSGEANGATGDFSFGIKGGKSFVNMGPSELPIYSTLSVNDGNPKIVSYTRNATNGLITHFVDGNANGSGTSNTGEKTNITSTSIFSLYANGSGDCLAGSISELVIFDQVLSETDRQKVEGVLAWKWGLTDSLPIDHPYKDVLPEQENRIKILSGQGQSGTIIYNSFKTPGQWHADGEPIFGEIASTLTLNSETVGKTITFVSGSTISNELSFEEWTPYVLSDNIVFWVDASDLSTITKDGSNRVSQWRSKIGPITLSQSTDVNKPIYNVTGRNGRPTLESNGSQTLLNFDSVTGLPVGGASSFGGIVAYRNTTSASWISLMRYGVAGNGQAREHATTNPSLNVAVTGIAGAWEVNSSISWSGSDRIVMSHINGSGSQLYIDGSIGANATNTATYNTGTNLSYSTFFRTSTNGWLGSCQEYIILNRNLTLDERQKLEGYMAHKWGLTSQLPANHPWKTSPPVVS